ncbi:aspartate aminotransferase family protein [Streptomyces chattanoogensis]|uniref:aspartate aminotransferase family protein n=1 Tax=Streptomyces chattanoogensis TaxID=66876 RepID=UPI001FDED916|nr:aminotransferase class III-fold pyridoxal phosphate-dependent enzyme [Streptomyces chattanoogensis]
MLDLGDRNQVLAVYRSHLSKGRASLVQLLGAPLEVSSSGTRVMDSQGIDYLSCGGYGVFLLGHCHPAVTEAVVRQVGRHPLATRLLLEPSAAGAAQALARVTPPGLDWAHFVNSGAESVEAALKLARAHGRRTVITTSGGYHGKTLGALSITANPLYQGPFEPLLPGVYEVPYGDSRALGAVLDEYPESCVVLEPVQGESGVVIPPSGYLREVRELCSRYGAFMILDEVQTGLGRTGRWWAAQREDVVPDMLLIGKGLSGGVVPVAALATTTELYKPFSSDPYLHTSTFGGSPLAMAAAQATIEAIESEGLVERARDLGADLLGQLRSITARCPGNAVTEIRGAGLLIGIEFRDSGSAAEFLLNMIEQRVLVNHSLNSQRVVRLTPPAILSHDDVSWLLDAFEKAVHSTTDRI